MENDTTTTVDDLAAWLTQIWDEDEKAARLAFSGQADPENGWGEEGIAVTPHVGVIHEDVQRAHVIRWHPGTVLARIAADRKILALHSGQHECPDEKQDVRWWVPGNRDYIGHDGEGEIWADGLNCLVARLLALPIADRPGYRQEWKP